MARLAARSPPAGGPAKYQKTREEVVRSIQDAIVFHIEGLKEDGEPVPEPASSVEFVDVAA